MNGKTIFIFILSHVASSGWWYCATQHETLAKHACLLLPVITTIWLIAFFCMWLAKNWEG